MMKVWSVSEYNFYEGHEVPLGVFSSEAKAQEFAASQKAVPNQFAPPDGYSIVEHELDVGKDGTVQN